MSPRTTSVGQQKPLPSKDAHQNRRLRKDTEASDGKRYFNFEGLPAELRNEIYRLGLVDSGSIELSGHIGPEASRGPLRPYVRAKVVMMEGKQRRVPRLGKVHAISIIRVNRQISTEALPVLYAENSFVFKTTGAFQKFAQLVGGNCRFLRDVEIQTFHLVKDRDLLVPLIQAHKLVRLHITINNNGKSRESTAEARLLHAVMPVLRRTKDDSLQCGCLPGSRSCASFTDAQRRILDTITFKMTFWECARTVGGRKSKATFAEENAGLK